MSQNYKSATCCCAHTSWGADEQTLLCFYRSLIRSKLDYGCIVYGSASYLDLPTLRSWNPFTIMLYACVLVHSGLHQQSVYVFYNTALSSVQIQITRHTMQFLIQSSKLSLTTSQAKLAHWALELKTTCRTSALRRMFCLQSFPQSHLGFSNALTVTSVYVVTIKQLLTQKCSNANSLSFAQSFHTM